VVPLSTAKKALRFPGTTRIAATIASGLREESVALVFQFRAIDRGRLRDQVGTISDAERDAVIEELRKLTGQSK